MEQAKIAISETFFTSFAKLPKQQQKKVMEFVNKFKLNPYASGINLEKIRDSRSDGVHSVRIDQTYRGILFKPKSGNTFMLLWVDHHDDAYDWAKRHNCEIHPSTGAIQIIDTQYVEQQVPEIVEQPVSLPLIFADYSKEQIIDLGVPESFIERVFSVRSETELEALESALPADAWEPLYLLAAGGSYEQIISELQESSEVDGTVDTEDFEAALERSATKRKFMLVEDDVELEQMLNAPLEKWRVFLHPSQRKLVKRDWNGPVRVTGGAGTGKTVVAIHRAKWLAENVSEDSSEKILFTTFTKNLAADIEQNLAKLCSPEVLNRIEVVNIDRWIHQFLKRHSYSYRIVYDGDEKRKKCWKNALNLKDDSVGLSDDFYEEEWRLVVQPQGVQNAKEYARAKRIGRGTPLNRSDRMKIWKVFEEYRNLLNYSSLKEMPDAMLDVADIIESKDISMPYSSVIVDESQDMGNQVFKLLRKVIPEAKNDMFMVGDGNQRIYSRKVVLGQCGVKIVGRSRKLKINYRTTEETRRFASAVMNGVQADNLDGRDETTGDYVSLFHGDVPTVEHFDTMNDELNFVIDTVRQLEADGVPTQDICLVARTDQIRQPYMAALQQHGILVYPVSRTSADDRSKPGVRVANMHRIKGLEFQYVIIVGVNDGNVPFYRAKSDDIVEQRALEFSERALFHVAATRAIKQLFVSSNTKKSPFLV